MSYDIPNKQQTLSITLADADDVIKIKRYRGFITSDYLQASRIMGTVFRWSDSPSDEEIDIAIEFNAEDNTLDRATNNANKVGYLMGKGMTLQEAQLFLTEAFSKFHVEERKSCVARRGSARLNEIFLKYLTLQDAIDFQTVTKNLTDYYTDSAIMGTLEGAPISGITDFLRDTGDYALTGITAQGYVINGGLLLTDFVNDVLDVLVEGNY